MEPKWPMRFVWVIGSTPNAHPLNPFGDWIPKGKWNLYDGQFWSWFFFRLKPTISKWRTPCKFLLNWGILLRKARRFFFNVFFCEQEVWATPALPHNHTIYPDIFYLFDPNCSWQMIFFRSLLEHRKGGETFAKRMCFFHIIRSPKIGMFWVGIHWE